MNEPQGARTIIAGSRAIPCCADTLDRLAALMKTLPRPTEVVSGGAQGADKLGEWWAANEGIPVKRFEPNYAVFRKAAPLRRNETMARYAAEVPGGLLVAVWDGQSHGTAHMIASARAVGLRVVTARYKVPPAPETSALFPGPR